MPHARYDAVLAYTGEEYMSICGSARERAYCYYRNIPMRYVDLFGAKYILSAKKQRR